MERRVLGLFPTADLDLTVDKCLKSVTDLRNEPDMAYMHASVVGPVDLVIRFLTGLMNQASYDETSPLLSGAFMSRIKAQSVFFLRIKTSGAFGPDGRTEQTIFGAEAALHEANRLDRLLRDPIAEHVFRRCDVDLIETYLYLLAGKDLDFAMSISAEVMEKTVAPAVAAPEEEAAAAAHAKQELEADASARGTRIRQRMNHRTVILAQGPPLSKKATNCQPMNPDQNRYPFILYIPLPLSHPLAPQTAPPGT